MPYCMVDSCCGCFDLKTGCLFIGYLSLTLEIIHLTLSMVAIVAGASVAYTSKDIIVDEFTGMNMLVSSIIQLVVGLISLPFILMLLVGVNKKKRNYVKIYLIASVISFVVSIALFFASFAGTLKMENVIANVLAIPLSIYFILVIRSYYYKMEERQPAVSDTA